MRPFGVPGLPAHRAERPAAARGRRREMEEPADRPSSASASANTRAGRVEVVDRHREAALGLVRRATAPTPRRAPRAAPRRRRRQRRRASVYPAFVTRDDGLTHLADRAPLERERRRAQHRLLADRESRACRAGGTGRGASAEALITASRQPCVRATRRNSASSASNSSSVAHRVAADQRRARDDAVREERAPGRREEVALVAPQREERQAVVPVRVDERACDPPLADGLRDGVRQRPQPEVERGEAEHEPERGEDVGEPVRDLAAVQLDAEDRRRRSRRPRRAMPSSGLRRARLAGNVEAPRGTARAPTSSASETTASSTSSPFAMCATADATTTSDGELPGAVAATARASARARRARCRTRARRRARRRSLPGGSTSRTRWSRSRMSGVSAEAIPITPTAAAAHASSDSGLGRRSLTRPG